MKRAREPNDFQIEARLDLMSERELFWKTNVQKNVVSKTCILVHTVSTRRFLGK